MCWTYIYLKNSFKIKGNHEDYYLKKKFNGKNRLTKKFFKESFYNFKRFDLIKEYKEEIIIDDIEFKHTIENKYIFSDTEINLKKNKDKKIAFYGATNGINSLLFFAKKRGKINANNIFITDRRVELN